MDTWLWDAATGCKSEPVAKNPKYGYATVGEIFYGSVLEAVKNPF